MVLWMLLNILILGLKAAAVGAGLAAGAGIVIKRM
jgi:hypothetical protein